MTILAALAAVATANRSSCGPDSPSKVNDCDKPDHGSCGGACCMVDYVLPARPGAVNVTAHLYNQIKSYLTKGGDDGSYAYVTGPDTAGHNPGDDLTPYGILWDYIFQGADAARLFCATRASVLSLRSRLFVFGTCLLSPCLH